MAWDVRLQDETGKRVIPYDAVIEFNTVPDDRAYTLLKYLDPYGDTYFNRIQMTDFLSDWDSLNPVGEQQTQWKLVREFAIRCKDLAHHYLRFIGD